MGLEINITKDMDWFHLLEKENQTYIIRTFIVQCEKHLMVVCFGRATMLAMMEAFCTFLLCRQGWLHGSVVCKVTQATPPIRAPRLI